MELLKLLLRNVLRHKLRGLLTIVGVSVAVMAFALLQTVVTARLPQAIPIRTSTSHEHEHELIP